MYCAINTFCWFDECDSGISPPFYNVYILTKYSMINNALELHDYDTKKSFGVLSFITEFKTRKEQVLKWWVLLQTNAEQILLMTILFSDSEAFFFHHLSTSCLWFKNSDHEEWYNITKQ